MVPRQWPESGAAATVAADPAVLRAWVADERPFFAVVVLLHSAALQRRMRAVVAALHPWCRPVAVPHVTLVATGEPPPTGIGIGRRCSVRVAGADSFAAASFLHADGVDVRRLRADLLCVTGEAAPAPVWVPHVTVGTYRWPMAPEHVAQRLGPMRELPALEAAGRVAVVRVGKRTGGLVEV